LTGENNGKNDHACHYAQKECQGLFCIHFALFLLILIRMVISLASTK
jgi:hypothetical protein